MFRKRKVLISEPVETAAAPSTARLMPRSPSDAIKPTAALPPPQRVRRPRGGLLSIISGLLTFGVVAAIAVFFGVVVLQRQAAQPGPLATDKVVVVPRGTGTSEMASLLVREGVIEQPFLFETYAFFNRQRGPMKAGEFLFKAHTNIEDAIDTLIEGKAILHAITVPEGLTSEQIMSRLNDNDVLSGEAREIPREGALLPDTYKFERGMTRQQLLNVMQAKQREVLNQIWARRSPDLPIKTPQELVILASVVEKETGRADERTRVAGVFINRLIKRMKLQSDPTIVYGLVGGKGTLGRGILRSEIEKATPYNTYIVEGLPPGPIANPGRAALEAAANPSRTKDIFFVADGSGGHAFAETLEQHQKNVARWRQIERGRVTPDAAAVDRVEPPADSRSDLPVAVQPNAVRPTAFTQDPALSADPFPNPSAGSTRPNAAPPPQGGPNRQAGTPGGRARSLDAVEGTPRDPLLNKTYDLNSPKTVPALRQQ